jgi:hypothetical protein
MSSGIYKLPEYKQHPVALALMPGGMDDTEFDAFCADVEERGILFPASLYEGMVLDGWHRYRAAKRTGSELKFIEYKGKDPAGYIASCNVLRRKLSSLQRALVGARLHRDHGITQREACKKLGISNEVITLVLKTLDSKNTKLIKRIESEADFTRGMLKEELEDAGLLRAKPKTDVDVSTLTNSVFDMARTGGVPRDTDGTEEDPEEDDGVGDILSVGKGLKADQRAARRPKESAAMTLSEGFRALMADERESFMQMIWPVAKEIVRAAAWGQDFTKSAEEFKATVVANRKASQDTPLKALARGKKVASV